MLNIPRVTCSLALAGVLLLTGCDNDSAKDRGSRPRALPHQDGMILIPAGMLRMGGDNEQADPNEFPKHDVAIGAFWLDETEVTNTQFEVFVQTTGYVTVAERVVYWNSRRMGSSPDTGLNHAGFRCAKDQD